ncbi:helix-turn-helix domain-containing protein [Nocardia cyriacigeorgica]|uniref:helix-turn-helix domain-containing protein n=1 Tax=Nocardia cyriacigeorgica TaxID=135487 RepID=UPI002457BB2F|nr:helix-turn-helix domain-containing protein [Nocardia cyriacigeorgica]
MGCGGGWRGGGGGTAAPHDLTRAAVDAGFASPSHFSDVFRAMFGLTPTAFLGVGSEVRIIDDAD